MHISHLEYMEPEAVCEILAGTFRWKDPQGQDCDADFYVRTCIDDDSQTNRTKRVDDLNEQMTSEWERLINEGNTHISFQNVIHNPFF